MNTKITYSSKATDPMSFEECTHVIPGELADIEEFMTDNTFIPKHAGLPAKGNGPYYLFPPTPTSEKPTLPELSASKLVENLEDAAAIQALEKKPGHVPEYLTTLEDPETTLDSTEIRSFRPLYDDTKRQITYGVSRTSENNLIYASLNTHPEFDRRFLYATPTPKELVQKTRQHQDQAISRIPRYTLWQYHTLDDDETFSDPNATFSVPYERFTNAETALAYMIKFKDPESTIDPADYYQHYQMEDNHTGKIAIIKETGATEFRILSPEMQEAAKLMEPESTFTKIKNKAGQLLARHQSTPFQRLIRNIEKALINARTANSTEILGEELKAYICRAPKTYTDSLNGNHPNKNAGKIGINQKTARRISDMLCYQSNILASAHKRTLTFKGQDGQKHTQTITPGMVEQAKKTIKTIEHFNTILFDPHYGFSLQHTVLTKTLNPENPEQEQQLTPEELAGPASLRF
jgi:hypothetical protein